MTHRDFYTTVNDVALMQKAKAIREYLCELSGLIPRLNESPNHFYGGTVEGLTLIDYYGGPSAVGTPYGRWSATGGGCLKKDWLPEATERLGLVELWPMFRNSMGDYGPIYSISKDLDGELLPLPKIDGLYINLAGIVTRNAFHFHTTSIDKLVAAFRAIGETSCPSWSNFDDAPTNPDDLEGLVEVCTYDLNRAYWSVMKHAIAFRDTEDDPSEQDEGAV